MRHKRGTSKASEGTSGVTTEAIKLCVGCAYKKPIEDLQVCTQQTNAKADPQNGMMYLELIEDIDVFVSSQKRYQC